MSTSSVQRAMRCKTDLVFFSMSRKFWQEILPRLKFHNPAIPMIVNRRPGPEGGAIMSVYFQNAAAAAAAAAPSPSSSSSPTQSAEADANAPSDSSASAPSDPVVRVQPPSSAIDTSKAVAPASDERVVQIDMQHKHSDDILQLFLAETKAIPVQPTPEELAELREAEAFVRQGEADRRMVRQHVETVRKEKEMLAKVREAAMSS